MRAASRLRLCTYTWQPMNPRFIFGFWFRVSVWMRAYQSVAYESAFHFHELFFRLLTNISGSNWHHFGMNSGPMWDHLWTIWRPISEKKKKKKISLSLSLYIYIYIYPQTLACKGSWRVRINSVTWICLLFPIFFSWSLSGQLLPKMNF